MVLSIAQAHQCTCNRRELDNHYCTCTGYDTHTYTLQSHITHTNALAREEPSLLAMIMCAKPVKAASP